MRVAIVSTYTPRACGIAVFSADLRSAILQADSATDVEIVSIVRDPSAAQPAEVAATIRQEVAGDYAAAARVVSSRGADVVLLEHEFGIFGGDAGEFALIFARAVTKPLVVTLHTVLSHPSPQQAGTLRALCERAALVTVFTQTARQMVVESGLVAADRVRVVGHGAPDLLSAALRSTADGGVEAAAPTTASWQRSSEKAQLPMARLQGRTVLSTFGLISASKGLELAIQALPAIVAAHPDVLYLIAGQTHPDVIKHEGEHYRLGLARLVRDLGLEDHVEFVDRFLRIEELSVLLSRTEIYLTPYRSREQIVSGALTFAVVAGCPVVSTPYLYAEDLLSSGAGVLVPFGNAPALATAVTQLLGSADRLAAARAEARAVGADLTWSGVGKAIVEVLAEAVHARSLSGAASVPSVVTSPDIRPDHLLTLVDDVGIVQHATGVIPNRASGYCLDDAARLVVVCLGLERALDDPQYGQMLVTALAFVFDAWDSSAAGMHNFMSYQRAWLDDAHQGDHLARAAWALGEVVATQPPREEARPCLQLLLRMQPALEALAGPRELAFAVLGLARPDSDALPQTLQDLLRRLSARLATWYDDHRREDWLWFENTLTYDNGRLPQALIAAGHRLGDADLVSRGLEALGWYADQCRIGTDTVRLVGNRWRRRGDGQANDGRGGDEQPIDAAALVEALTEASRATGRADFGQQAIRAFEWFLGRNSAGAAVYNFTTGGCHDGLGVGGLNDNEGAESTLAFLQALLALEEAGLQVFTT